MNCPFGALAELSAGAILVVRPTGSVVYGNPASARLLGANPTGQSLLDWASESVRPHLCGFLGSLQYRDSAASTAFTACELRHADGRMIWVQIQGVNAGGVESVDGLILALFDISQYKHRETELLNAVSRDALTGLPNRGNR